MLDWQSAPVVGGQAPAQPTQRPMQQPTAQPMPQQQPRRIYGAPEAPKVPEPPRAPNATEVYRLLTPEEITARGLPKGGIYQVNDAGKVDVVQAPPKSTAPSTPEGQSERRTQVSTILGNIRDLERTVKKNDVMSTGSIVGQESFRQGQDYLGLSSLFNQQANDVAGKLQMVQGDLIQQQIQLLAQANNGGVSGLANSQTEAERMAASIANLSQTQDEGQFLVGLERARDYYLRRYVENGGDPGEFLSSALKDGASLPEMESYAKAMGVEIDREKTLANIQYRDGGGDPRNFEPDPNGAPPSDGNGPAGMAAKTLYNTAAGYAQGAGEAVIDFPQTIGSLPAQGMNSLIGGARALYNDVTGDPQEAARIRAETDQMNARVRSVTTPVADTFNALLPAPAGYETQRDVARFAGGFLVPGPKGAKAPISAPASIAQGAPRAASGMIDNAAAVVAEGRARNVPVMTTDVRPPQSAMGRMVKQTVPEKIPFAGMSGPRASQQEARIQAVKDVVDEFGGDSGRALMDGSEAVQDIAKTLGTTRANRISSLKGAKDGVIDGIQAPFNAAPNTVKAIQDQVRKLQEIDPEEFAPVIERLQRFGDRVTSGQSLRTVEEQRRLLGELFTDPNLARIKTRGQAALNAIYGPLREDMGNFIQQQGGTAARTKWSKANEELSAMAGELKSARFKAVLRDTDTTPEAVGRILFSGKDNVSDMERLVKNLPPAGQKKVQAALIQRAFDSAGGSEGVSVERFLNNVKNNAAKFGIAFQGADRQALEGVRRLLEATRRGAEAGANVRTGEQNLPTVLGIGATQALGAVGGIGTLGIGGLVARIYESAPIRDRLLRLASTKAGSPQESRLLEVIMRSATPIVNEWKQNAGKAINDNTAGALAAESQDPQVDQ
ncbi:hypothetical protein UFOVP368_18 [uncultured Caudovirales phage]|uniref:Uncharacterized protein n=1 Tax=uncultured Caudovirales phage TaxID=2100421 RepID=A0A6J7WXU6_9CAUD|nr:hypothetical protein UFOVP368_18 [uncultured Caudovirales phage]